MNPKQAEGHSCQRKGSFGPPKLHKENQKQEKKEEKEKNQGNGIFMDPEKLKGIFKKNGAKKENEVSKFTEIAPIEPKEEDERNGTMGEIERNGTKEENGDDRQAGESLLKRLSGEIKKDNEFVVLMCPVQGCCKVFKAEKSLRDHFKKMQGISGH